jgi:hypothetical protein
MQTENSLEVQNKGLAALKAWRDNGGEIIRLNPVERAQANPKSKALAIKAHCYVCSGESANEAKLCTVQKCPLYLHNPYKKMKGGANVEDTEDSQEDQQDSISS